MCTSTIFRFSRSGKGEVDVYRFLCQHRLDYYMLVCLDFLSHLAIDASSGMKLMHGRTDVLKATHNDLTLLQVNVNLGKRR